MLKGRQYRKILNGISEIKTGGNGVWVEGFLTHIFSLALSSFLLLSLCSQQMSKQKSIIIKPQIIKIHTIIVNLFSRKEYCKREKEINVWQIEKTSYIMAAVKSYL
jgi:hypothetical protein